MTDVVEVALIMSIPSTLGVMLSYYNGVLARRTERRAQATHDALVSTTRRESYAAGVSDQKDRQAEVQDAIDKALDKSTAIPSVVERQEKDT